MKRQHQTAFLDRLRLVFTRLSTIITGDEAMRYQHYSDHQADPDPEPEEDPSTQTTQPYPPAASIADEYEPMGEQYPNCALCLHEFELIVGDERELPLEPGRLGLCWWHQEMLGDAKPEELVMIRGALNNLFNHFETVLALRFPSH